MAAKPAMTPLHSSTKTQPPAICSIGSTIASGFARSASRSPGLLSDARRCSASSIVRSSVRAGRMETSCAMTGGAPLRHGSQALAHQQVLMAAWMIVDCRDDLEAAHFVEGRRLERERHQHDLRTAATLCFLLGAVKQLRPESAMTSPFLDPELTQFTGAAPRVAANP